MTAGEVIGISRYDRYIRFLIKQAYEKHEERVIFVCSDTYSQRVTLCDFLWTQSDFIMWSTKTREIRDHRLHRHRINFDGRELCNHDS